MNLEVGQVYLRRGGLAPRYVLVCEVRDDQHPRGLGEPYGDTGLAIPLRSRIQPAVDIEKVHPFDVEILCDAQKSHGDLRWRLDEDITYAPGPDGRWYPTWRKAA